MNCDKFKQYELGEIDDLIFNDHLKTCEQCQAHEKADKELMGLAVSLKQPVQINRLWDRIEDQLKGELKKQQMTGKKETRLYWNMLRVAAVVVLIVGMTVIIKVRHKPKSTGLLSEAVLVKVEKQENEYIKAIAELEKSTKPLYEQMDMELQLLYRDRLETIDRQIALCKKAIDSNPANAHIRKYLMIALKDKKETLIEIKISDLANGQKSI
ncbi:MAG: hypothetical protein PVG39_22485 [Desulfobacteraceae bacterium]|jgi:hypothetical protein